MKISADTQPTDNACVCLDRRGVMPATYRRGRQTYELHCSVCHGIDGMPIDMTIPSFANGDRLFQMDQDLLRSIREGRDLMPAFRGLLSDDEIRNVIAYLRTL